MAKNMFVGFLFSYVGLFFILMIYCSLGALLFSLLESSDMDNWLEGGYNASVKIEEKRKELKEQLVKMKKAEYIDPLLNTSTIIWMDEQGRSIMNARKYVRDLVDAYHLEVARAIHKFSYTGALDEPETSKWSFWSGFLFCASVITAIGYGHISPASDFGRFILICYSLLGVPMCLMFVANVSDAMQIVLRALIKYLLCGFCRSHRMKVYAEAEARKPKEEPKVAEPQEGAEEGLDDLLQDEFKAQNDVVIETTQEEEGDADPKDPSSLMEPTDYPIPLFLVLFVVILYLFFGAVMFVFTEKWSILESNYFTFVSLTTIGFGDYYPGMTAMDTFAGKLHLAMGSVYIIIGLGVVGMGINVAILTIVLKTRAAARAAGVVESMDEDGDGMDDGDEEVIRKLNLTSKQ